VTLPYTRRIGSKAVQLVFTSWLVWILSDRHHRRTRYAQEAEFPVQPVEGPDVSYDGQGQYRV